MQRAQSTSLLLCAFIVACSDRGGGASPTVDAASPAVDAGPGVDAIASPDAGSMTTDSSLAGDDAQGGMPPQSMTSVTKDGITWTFSQAVPVGQFVTGDYYVVGPVTIAGISPPPQTAAPYMNGSVKNLPTKTGHSAFDQRLNDGTDQSWFFDPSFRLYPPFSLEPGDALVSSVSLAQPHTLPEPFGDPPNPVNQSPIQTMSVLTVLSAAPASDDAFRPSYCDRAQEIYYAHNVQRSLLPSLAPPDPSQVPTLSTYEESLRRPWIDVTFFLWDVPGAYMPSYSRDFGFVESYAALLLTLNFPAAQKVTLTNEFIERGIDLYGCAQAGVKWPAWGGYGHGRKLAILFAGMMLGEPKLTNVSASFPDIFGEDMQTVYVSHIPGGYAQAWQGATVIYGGHEGVKSDGTTVDPSGFSGGAGPYEQLQPSKWTVWSGEQIGESYRRCCTSMVFVGEALAARLLNLQASWNYPAFFDYADRWMNEDDTQAVATIKMQSGFDYSADWDRQRQTATYLQGRTDQPTFIDDMWKTYRTQ
jgi:hypothetical protein